MRRARNEISSPARVGRLLAGVAMVLVVSSCSSTPDNTVEGTMHRVIDSEALEVTIDGATKQVNLLNITTPASESGGANCLAPQATAFVQQMLPSATAVRLEYEAGPQDTEGRETATVYVDDRSVNEAVVAAGLGLADPGDGADENLEVLLTAQERAQAAQVGLFSAEVDCTVPGQVKIAAGVDCANVAVLATAAATASSAPGTSPSPSAASPTSTTAAAAEQIAGIALNGDSTELIQLVESAAVTMAKAVELQQSVPRDQGLLIWRALNPLQRNACAVAINDFAEDATRNHTELAAALVVAQQREAEEARVAEQQRQEEASRVAEAQRVAAEQEAARVAEVQRLAAEAVAAQVAEQQRVAAEAEAARVATEEQRAAQAAEAAAASRASEQQRQQEADDNSQESSGSSGSSSGGGNPSGYTGPRCYAPGGTTWKPC